MGGQKNKMVNKIIGLRVLILPLSLGIVVMLAILFIQPKYLEMRNYKKSAEEEKAQLASLQDQSQKLAQLKSTWQSMEERKIIEVALPGDESFDDFLSEMHQKAARSGVMIDDVGSSQKSSSGDLSYSCPSPGEMAAATGGTGEVSPSSSSQASGALTLPSSSSCAKSLIVEIGIKGTWEQMLNFFRNIAESNRVANLKKISLASGVQSASEQPASDILSGKVTLEVYYKPKSEKGNSGVLSSLASQAGFSKNVISKIKEMVYSPYEAPAVYEAGERNIFK